MMIRMIYLMGLGLARARRAGMRGTSVTDAARRTAMTAMLVMLAAMTAWAENVTVNYIDADGNQQSVSATVLTGSESALGSYGTTKWYVVNSTISHEGQIVCEGNVNIILADGKTMTTSNSSYGIKATIGTLTIYGQTNGSGTLEVTSTGSSAIAYSGNVVICGGTVNATAGGNCCSAIDTNGNVTINGGTVNATATAISGNGIVGNSVTINGGSVTATANNNGDTGIDANIVTINGGTVSASSMDGIYAYTSVTISGGKVTASGNVKGIDAHYGSGTITLGLCTASDFITSNSYRGTVNIKDDQRLTDGTNIYSGNGVSIPGNKTLRQANFTDNGDDTYTIHNAAGWGVFCDALEDNTTYGRFSGKTVKLANDITVTRMAGSANHDFMGEFDGNEKTLTVSYGSAGSPLTEQYAAPFRYVESGANIHSLAVEGDIYTSEKYAGGIVGLQCGAVTISDCRSSVAIHSSVEGDGTHGGLVGLNNNTTGSELTIEGCLFNGKLLTTSTTDRCSGFVGWRGGTVSIRNSLYAPAVVEGETWVGDNESATFVRNDGEKTTIKNCYYTATLGTV